LRAGVRGQARRVLRAGVQAPCRVLPEPLSVFQERGCPALAVMENPKSKIKNQKLFTPVSAQAAFTLVEILVAMALLGAALAITFSTFHGIAKAYQRGLSLVDSMNHGEYVMEQLSSSLRSAFYPPSQSNSSGSAQGISTNRSIASRTHPQVATPVNSATTNTSGNNYGLRLEDQGAGASARDKISWVKTGSLLLKYGDPLVKGVHRVQVTVEDDEDGIPGLAVRAWRPFVSLTAADPSSLPAHVVAPKVVGLDCRVAYEKDGDAWDWQDAVDDEATNSLPMAVEISLYFAPLEKGEEPIEIKRMVEIPVAPFSWKGKK